MRASPIVLVLLAACGGSSPPPLGVRQNLEEARRHDADARRLDQVAEAEEERAIRDGRVPEACGDAPCWSREREAARRSRDEADRLRADAAAHRARASSLLEAERASCAAMPAAELDHTPFAHREDVLAVVAALDGDVLRGAVIRFQPLPGLTAAWLEDAIACHDARAAALGFDERYMAYDPTVLPGVDVVVHDERDGPVVEIRTDDDETAMRVYLRAEALLDPSVTP